MRPSPTAGGVGKSLGTIRRRPWPLSLLLTLEAGTGLDPEQLLSEITYRGHRANASELCSLFPGLQPAQLPDGMGWAVQDVRISTHKGTQMDAS